MINTKINMIILKLKLALNNINLSFKHIFNEGYDSDIKPECDESY